ncbi:anti-sigma factor RsbA family regulatory protein [Kitasatospora sp. CMC57]|uniref:Anti-sigma factor RsbA family regulatory protein n=1 Tax=Kitasatospora sp. CMC57 TaxID=3231513 RepID=A0AB33JQY2_9ACTN
MTSGVAAPFVHLALLYRTQEEYLREVGSFVHRAVEADEPVLVAVPGPRLAAVRESLGASAGPTEFTDMTVLGRNPGRILAALQHFADQHPGRVARIVGEPVWPGRSDAEILEATRHEALVNTAFAGRPATVLCPYDLGTLGAEVVRDVGRTHPCVVTDGTTAASPGFVDPRIVCADCETPLPEPTDPAALTVQYAAGRLAAVRRSTETWARGSKLSDARRDDLVLAVGEAAANSVAHGGGSGTLRLWVGQDAGVVAEIRDRGAPTDPLAGRQRPTLTSGAGGRGLWIIHQLSDLVELRVADGLTLRMHFRP